MQSIKIVPLIMNFALILFIGFKTLNTLCFSGLDLNLALSILIFSVIVEIVIIKENKI